MISEQIIEPGRGLGNLIFGSLPEEVIELFGLPDDDFFDEEGDRIFRYPSQGIKLACFDKSENFKLVSLEIDKLANALLWKNSIFKYSIPEAHKIFNQNGFELSAHEVCDEMQLRCNKLAIELYFENNILKSLSFGVFVDSNDKINWP